MMIDLQRYTTDVANRPYGLTGVRPELSVEGAFVAAREAMRNHEAFSIVRMGDGETQILDYCDEKPAEAPMERFDKAWRVKYGVDGITCGEIKRRLLKGAEECTILGQDGWIPYCITGVRRFIHRAPFVWPNFPAVWTDAQKRELYALSENRVLVMNRNPQLARQVCVSCDYFCLDNWRDSQAAITYALTSPARLVLVSGGPASKYVCPEIARQHGGRVALDIGSAPERGVWWNGK